MVADGRDDRRSVDGSPESVWARIKEEHNHVVRLLAELESVSDLGRTLEIVTELCEFMPAHFANEEGPNGLYERLVQTRPGVDSRLKSMHREHREILYAFERVREKVQSALEGSDEVASGNQDEIRWVKTDALARIRDHEREENSLVMETYLTDEGGTG